MPNDFVKRANVHQLHIEDLVLLGEKGLNELNHKIENFIRRLDSGDGEQLNTTVKLDGAPAVTVWSSFPGYPDNSVGIKSSLKNANNALSSPEDVEAKYGDRPVMAQMLKYCLQIAKSIPANEMWQGDCLFTKNSKKEREIQGKKYLTFQPNTIIYAFSEENPGYEKVKNADFGIAFHTIYRPGENGEKSQDFSLDPSILSVPDNIYIMSPAIDTNKESFNIAELQRRYDELKQLEEKLISDPDYEDLIDNNFFMSYWNTFENANISDKHTNTLDINTFYDDLKAYIKDKRTKEYEKKVSTLKTDKAKAGAKEKYDFDMIELEDILNTNKKLLGNLVRCLNAAAEIKMELWNGFKQSQQDYSTFYQSRSQGYKPADAEGISMSDSDGNIVKIVDRANFSANNRDADIVKGFEHESLNEESNNREFIETELFTRK